MAGPYRPPLGACGSLITETSALAADRSLPPARRREGRPASFASIFLAIARAVAGVLRRGGGGRVTVANKHASTKVW